MYFADKNFRFLLNSDWLFDMEAVIKKSELFVFDWRKIFQRKFKKNNITIAFLVVISTFLSNTSFSVALPRNPAIIGNFKLL